MKTLFSNDEDDDDDGEDDECDDEEEEEEEVACKRFPSRLRVRANFRPSENWGERSYFFLLAPILENKYYLRETLAKQANEEEEDGDDDHWWLLIQDILLFRTVGGYLNFCYSDGDRVPPVFNLIETICSGMWNSPVVQMIRTIFFTTNIYFSSWVIDFVFLGLVRSFAPLHRSPIGIIISSLRIQPAKSLLPDERRLYLHQARI